MILHNLFIKCLKIGNISTLSYTKLKNNAIFSKNVTKTLEKWDSLCYNETKLKGTISKSFVYEKILVKFLGV